MEMNWQDVVSNAQVYGLEESIRRAKYPMAIDATRPTAELTEGIKNLAQSEKGAGHDQWLTGVIVQFDLTFTVKAWTEAERYHFLDFVSSQSTMHKITKFNLDTAYINYVDPRIIPIIKDKVEKYNQLQEKIKQIKETNYLNKEYTKELQEECIQLYLEILYSNPCGMKLTAGITTNYRQLKTIYSQRKAHRLPEWRAFCKWVETLPMSELITGKN